MYGLDYVFKILFRSWVFEFYIFYGITCSLKYGLPFVIKVFYLHTLKANIYLTNNRNLIDYVYSLRCGLKDVFNVSFRVMLENEIANT